MGGGAGCTASAGLTMVVGGVDAWGEGVWVDEHPEQPRTQAKPRTRPPKRMEGLLFFISVDLKKSAFYASLQISSTLKKKAISAAAVSGPSEP